MSEVNLIALSKPSAITDCFTAEQLIAYCARVSNPANQNNTATAPKLLKYLMDNAHHSPFEMVHMTLEIKTTRDIARQILRHRSFSFQEFSQRYAEATDFETREARMQDLKNRQNSTISDDQALNEWWSMEQRKAIQRAEMSYRDALNKGIAKEQARALLPEGLTGSTLYMAGTLRSWIHYCELRRSHGTQREHIEIADKCWDIVSHHFPSIADALSDKADS